MYFFNLNLNRNKCSNEMKKYHAYTDAVNLTPEFPIYRYALDCTISSPKMKKLPTLGGGTPLLTPSPPNHNTLY